MPINTFYLDRRLELARTASNHARAALHDFKSDNKLRFKDKPKLTREDAKRRREQSKRLLNEYQEDFLPGSIAEVKSCARDARFYKAGNCMEYACLAFDWLYNQNLKGMELVAIQKPLGHTFLILGSSRKPGIYRAGLELQDQAVVCDPWANIVCAVNDYASQWRIKMLKWQAEAKYILHTPDKANVKPSFWAATHFSCFNSKEDLFVSLSVKNTSEYW